MNTRVLEGVPSMDRDGWFYFISPRSYDATLSTVYRGCFERGRVSDVRMVEGLATPRRGIVTFDAEISADGRFLYGVDGDFSGGGPPKHAKIFIAARDGETFHRLAESERLLESVNADDLQYAPSISPDGLTLFYTRLTGFLFMRKTEIMVARRPSTAAPFGRPEPVKGIDGFVEAPSLSPDGRYLYFHKRIDGTFKLFRLKLESQ